MYIGISIAFNSGMIKKTGSTVHIIVQYTQEDDTIVKPLDNFPQPAAVRHRHLFPKGGGGGGGGGSGGGSAGLFEAIPPAATLRSVPTLVLPVVAGRRRVREVALGTFLERLPPHARAVAVPAGATAVAPLVLLLAPGGHVGHEKASADPRGRTVSRASRAFRSHVVMSLTFCSFFHSVAL